MTSTCIIVALQAFAFHFRFVTIFSFIFFFASIMSWRSRHIRNAIARHTGYSSQGKKRSSSSVYKKLTFEIDLNGYILCPWILFVLNQDVCHVFTWSWEPSNKSLHFFNAMTLDSGQSFSSLSHILPSHVVPRLLLRGGRL